MGRWWRYKWITFHPSLTTSVSDPTTINAIPTAINAIDSNDVIMMSG
ncbi:conserved hypothetical protein [Yersinia pestis biovar Orientalis str. IP275]|uniref:Uncharacterized protein n=1 Tax=Yersinia pestis biovar Orientalis str. IP275 TaxID=373665 RepID=A0AAV3BK60_YERPE|nr:conserved hypothetical protein [Yersinia pestis biovar Orientalis str. IP275]